MSYKNDLRILDAFALRELMKQKRKGTLNVFTWKPRIKILNKYLGNIKNKRLKNLTKENMNEELSLDAKKDFIRIAEFINRKIVPKKYEKRLTYKLFKSPEFVNKQLRIIKKIREMLKKIKISNSSRYENRKSRIIKILDNRLNNKNNVIQSDFLLI